VKAQQALDTLALDPLTASAAAAAYAPIDHDHAGEYLESETDPVFSASDAAAITSTQISNWDDAHGWGDHAGLYTTPGKAIAFALIFG
jgi:hypothetical protein